MKDKEYFQATPVHQWVPSDELVETIVEATFKPSLDGLLLGDNNVRYGAIRPILKAAVASAELVPKSWLVKCGFWSEQMEADSVFETSKGLDSEKSNAFQDWVPVYRIIEPAQPNDGGE